MCSNFKQKATFYIFRLLYDIINRRHRTSPTETHSQLHLACVLICVGPLRLLCIPHVHGCAFLITGTLMENIRSLCARIHPRPRKCTRTHLKIAIMPLGCQPATDHFPSKNNVPNAAEKWHVALF